MIPGLSVTTRPVRATTSCFDAIWAMRRLPDCQVSYTRTVFRAVQVPYKQYSPGQMFRSTNGSAGCGMLVCAAARFIERQSSMPTSTAFVGFAQQMHRVLVNI